jgi:hypothetical protein
MKKLANILVLFSLAFCCSNLYAYVNNPNSNFNNSAAASSDNSLDDSDTISGSDAHPDDPEMRPPPSNNPGFQPPASSNPGLQPGPSDNTGLQPED